MHAYLDCEASQAGGRNPELAEAAVEIAKSFLGMDALGICNFEVTDSRLFYRRIPAYYWWTYGNLAHRNLCEAYTLYP